MRLIQRKIILFAILSFFIYAARRTKTFLKYSLYEVKSDEMYASRETLLIYLAKLGMYSRWKISKIKFKAETRFPYIWNFHFDFIKFETSDAKFPHHLLILCIFGREFGHSRTSRC